MLDHAFDFHIRQSALRDAALIVIASAVCVAPLQLWRSPSPTLMVTVTAAMVGAAMYSRLAMGRWRVATLVGLTALLLATFGAQTRLIIVVASAGLFASEWVARVPPLRLNFVKVGLGAALVAAAVALSGVGAVAPVSWSQASITAMATALGALMGPGLMLAFAPIAESALGHVTPMTLTEWLSYDHPLLRELAVNAPGTFQHSVNVGLLADAAARAIGADVLRSRIGGLYHDVGKLRAPGFFVENQSGDNPHDRLEPLASVQIVRAHVTDGLALVHAHHMGHVVADSVREHHGHGLMRLFHQKALERGDPAPERDFSYEGPSPRSRETAIVMMADQLEATARSAPPANLADCERLAAETLDRIAATGELKHSSLSGKDLGRARVAFARAVFAMYHRRMTYPATPVPPATPALVSRVFRPRRRRT